MLRSLVGLEGVEIYRPREYGGQLELQVGAPAERCWPTRMCRGLEITLVIGPTHPAVIQGRHTETPGKVTFVQSPGTVWSAPHAVGGFLSLEIAPPLLDRLVAQWPGRTPLPASSRLVLPGLLDAFWTSHKVLRWMGDTTARSEALVRLVGLVFEQLRGAPALSGVPDGVSRVRDTIHDAPANEPTIEELAALAGLTPFELVRAFHKRYGLTPASYRRALRLAQARWMLAAGRAPQEVAGELGFGGPGELVELFASRIGLTPESYAAIPAGDQRAPVA